MFKVGDKVCDPVCYGNGEVYHTSSTSVRVRFLNGVGDIYTCDGKHCESDLLRSLYHGHMEEGTCKITFMPKKEPLYEWQWEYETVIGVSKFVAVTTYYVSEQAMLKDFATPFRKDFIRIERSKRERKE